MLYERRSLQPLDFQMKGIGFACELTQVTLVGDLVTLCAAVTVIGYFEMGQRLRAWMPIFLYACPATGGMSCNGHKFLSHLYASCCPVLDVCDGDAPTSILLVLQALRHFC